jgi:hypothetical protein
MITQPTVLVLGAGASHEYGLPLGPNLKDAILKALLFAEAGRDQFLFECLQNDGIPNPRSLVEAGQFISRHSFPYDSIDEVLHAFSDKPEAVTVGKLAIASQIIAAEQKSKLYSRDGLHDFSRTATAAGWLPRFYSLGINGVTRKDIASAFNNVVMINFNYDRCVEFYIYNATLALGMPHEVAVETVEGLRMIRPYGSLGPLPWQEKDGSGYGVHVRGSLQKLAGNLRTFTEALDHEIKSGIGKTIDESINMLYLGFGFHPQNFQLLRSSQFGSHRIFATAFRLHQDNHEQMKEHFMSALRKTDGRNIVIRNSTCETMFNEMWPAISFAVG